MRVAGVDADTKTITICVIDGQLSHMIRLAPKGRRAEDRFQSLVEQIQEAVSHDPLAIADYVYVERPFVGPSRKAAIGMGMVVGALRAALIRRGIRHSLIDPSVWKTNTLGTSCVSKEEIKQWAMVRFDLKDNLAQDYYDAACIAAYGVQVLGGKV